MGVNYQWLLNGTAISGATASTLKPLNTGLFKLEITDPNGCTNSSDSFKLVVTAINNLLATPSSNLAKIYPNPATEFVTLSFSNLPSVNLNFQILDANGKLLQSATGRNKLNSINIKALQSGVYYLRVVGTQYDQVQKLFIQKK